MKSLRLRDLKAKIQAAKESVGVTDRPMCQRCQCPPCAKRRNMTSDEKRQRFGELFATARRRAIENDPDLPVRELAQQVAEPGFAELLERVGFRFAPIAKGQEP